MSIEQLPPFEPTEQEPTHDYTVDLSGVTYRLEIQWFERLVRWYISLYDASDVLLISNKRMSIDYPLFWRNTGRKPAGGYLFLVDVEETGAECGFEELGNRCKLVWVTLDEFPAAESAYNVTFEKTAP